MSRKTLIGLAALFVAVFGWRAWRLSRSAGGAPPPQGAYVGAPAPQFKLPELGGTLVSLSQFRGRPVLVNFWATWCPGCEEEMPDLEKLYEKHKKDGLEILAISVDEDRKPVMPFVARLNPSFKVLLCDENTAHAYDVFGLPTTFLVDADGVVVKKYVGGIDPAQTENDILPLLKRRPS